MKRFAILFIAIFLFTTGVFGQTTSGTVRGRVVDPTGAVVVGAEVSIIGTTTAERKAQTNQAGEFNFNNLTAGKYTIRVVSSGFALYENAEVVVSANRIVALDVALSVAAAEAQVTVGEEEPINTNPDANSSAIVLQGKDIEVLPDNDADLEAALQAL